MDLSDHLLFSRAQSTTFGTCLSLTQTFSKQTRKKVLAFFGFVRHRPFFRCGDNSFPCPKSLPSSLAPSTTFHHPQHPPRSHILGVIFPFYMYVLPKHENSSNRLTVHIHPWLWYVGKNIDYVKAKNNKIQNVFLYTKISVSGGSLDIA